MSERVREVLLRELDGREARPADETVLAEVLALRTIVLNAFSYDTRIARTFLAALATFSI
jgi:hypothetical protein